jgi:UDP-GlcNAc:undecaprenyl-phosphate GlcNAc-1-phosphate transferase
LPIEPLRNRRTCRESSLMIMACLLSVVVGLLVGCPLTAAARTIALRWGIVDQPGHRKIHRRAIPVTGGIAIFWTLALIIGGVIVAVWVFPESFWQRIWPAAVAHLRGLRSQTPMAGGLLACLAALHFTGLIDDRRNLGPFVKLIVQLVTALVMAGLFNVRLLELAWWGAIPSIALTVVWFIVITNAFNFLDNMDGLSGGVAAICGSILLTIALLNGQWFVGGVLGALVGALLGFLVFNLPPASIFMGDAGSLVVGFLVAFCSVRVTYYDPSMGPAPWWAVFTPLIVLAIPLYDLTSVTLIRLAQGRSPFVGDTQHFSHRLVRKGLSRRAAVMVIYACTLAAGLGGILLGRLTEGWAALLVVAQTLAILLVLALLERTAVVPEQAP